MNGCLLRVIDLNVFDHVGIYVKNLETSVRFYKELFGFKEYSRLKDGGITIVFLDMGGGLLQLKQRDDPGNPSSGKWSHFAVYSDEYDTVKTRLDKMGINYWEMSLGPGQRLTNFSDPDGHDVEVCEKAFM